MSRPIRYPVPWDLVFGLTRHIANRTQESVDWFTEQVVARLNPSPVFEGLENLPDSPRFVLAANHYQRPGLWILHTASVLTRGVRQRYGPGDPPVRWIVTANWPRVRLGPWSVRNPGDLLLPRVAHALACYPVAFAGRNPGATARSLRRILRDAETLSRPIGIFPEGVAGAAGHLTPALAGVDRLLVHLARKGWSAQPAGVTERGGFLVRFGLPVSSRELLSAPDAAQLVMDRIARLLEPQLRGA